MEYLKENRLINFCLASENKIKSYLNKISLNSKIKIVYCYNWIFLYSHKYQFNDNKEEL